VSSAVLDASAVLAVLNQETGADQVVPLITAGAAISAVNLAEVVGKLADAGVPETVIHAALDPLGLEVMDFDSQLAYRTGLLRPLTRAAGLSLGDRACLALAERLGQPAITSDQTWVGLVSGITVQPFR
jgi:ribonuclease VapC